MIEILSNFFQKENIDHWAPIPLSECTVIRPYLLEREKIESGSVIMICVPYFTRDCMNPTRNVSAYAVSRDYHRYFKDLLARLREHMYQHFPSHRFAAFADHSPIAEVEAAAKAGLGVIGKNHLLLTQKYSSYVFLGELITDAVLPSTPVEIQICKDCGRCQTHCPASSIAECLSALTQKKGELTEEEIRMLQNHSLVWGCDLCQENCPYTQNAILRKSIFSPIPFFNQKTIPHLTLEALSAMSEEEFLERAYSWRGRNTILRNLKLKESEGDSVC